MSSCSNKRKSNTRNPTPKLTIPKKVVLTDLCAKEKGKIGQLIVLIQKYRINNSNLSDEIKLLKQTNQELVSKNMRLEYSVKQKHQRITELLKVMDEYQEHLDKKEQEEKEKRKSARKNQRVVKNQSVQTSIQQNESNSLTPNHRISTSKDASIDINTQTQQGFFHSKNARYLSHSKQKVKNKSEQLKQKHSKAYKKIMKSINNISKAVDERNLQHSKNANSSIMSQADDQEFSNLARLWMKIKKQNQHENRSGKQIFKTNPYRSVDSVAQQNENIEDLITHYNRIKMEAQKTPPEDDLIDLFDLNDKLKRKDFKANDLLKSAIRGQKDKKTIQYY